MTSEQIDDAKATADALMHAPVEKFTNAQGVEHAGFNMIDFLRVMKLVAFMPVAVTRIAELEARVAELEAVPARRIITLS